MVPFVEHFDHFVVPVDDLVAAESFYAEVFGGRIALNASGRPMRFGLNVAQRNGGQVPHTFFDIGGRRIGVYLQEQERSKRGSVYGIPTYAFAATERGLSHVLSVLKRRAAEYVAAENDSPNALSSIYFNDPAGNSFHVFVPKTRSDASKNGGDEVDLAVSDLRIEAPDLDRSVRFYAEILGLDVSAHGKDKHSGAAEAVLRLPSGQSLYLTQVPFSPKGIGLSRTKPGPHLAFYVEPERWDSLVKHLAAKGIANGDRSTAFKGRTAADRDTYLDEPSGHVIQLVSAAAT